MFPLALGVVGFMGASLVYAVYLHVKVRQQMGEYPESVGLKLRRALYFTDNNLDPAQAMKAYMGALAMAEQERLHPLSDAVLGIWLQMARFLELIGHVKEAIEVLDIQRQHCLTWIEEEGNEEGNAGDRTRLLQKAIQMSSKIGELFSSPYFPDKQKSGEFLTWSVETMLKENERRRREGLKPGEGEMGITRDEQGAQMEGMSQAILNRLDEVHADMNVALGHHYEEKDNFFFASQLFLQALMIKPTQDCHSVILMNNLAAAMAQQRPLPEPGQPPPSPEQLRESGRAWARKALELASTIQPPERDQECDTGCVAATHNLGEFAEMDGNVAEARERYEEAGSIAHAIGFEQGVISANEGLKRLSAPPVKTKKRGGFWR